VEAERIRLELEARLKDEANIAEAKH